MQFLPMNILSELKSRFRGAVSDLADDPDELLDMIRPGQDARFGDYQANVAMPLGKRLGKSPRDVAQQIVIGTDLAPMCDPAKIAGPGFINLRLCDKWLVEQLDDLITDQRLGVERVTAARSFVVDYSSPNVAKPMHVGHIRSTVIGDALCRILRFLGHEVIGDNHLGDWGTQFGMIIYGYRHFVDQKAYRHRPVDELSRVYRRVVQLIDFHAAKQAMPAARRGVQDQGSRIVQNRSQLEQVGDDATARKKIEQALKRLQSQHKELQAELATLEGKVGDVEADAVQQELASRHSDIADAVLRETVRLHEGDEENLQLWREFLPHCREEIQRVYDRLHIRFDAEYGESFYHDQLAGVVDSFLEAGLARESDGAICAFLDGFNAPLIIRKQDGAFLYATTDLATIAYRVDRWHPDAVLYIVDHRQKEHFDKLFAAARLWGHTEVEFQHISFGTVLGEDGKPFKTRTGDAVGLEGLLDEAESKAYDVVCENRLADDLPDDQRRRIARVIGIAALKYADLSHNRTSDYVFSYDKMLQLRGDTATYAQYAYARVQSIFARGGIDPDQLASSSVEIQLAAPEERALALQLLRLPEAIDSAAADYRPNHLTSYLFDLANAYSRFFEGCPVLKAETTELRDSRLKLCYVTGRVIKQGLALLGIDVVERM